MEVETPALSRDTAIDRYLEPLEVFVFSDPTTPKTGDTFFLQTSPEFAMKRLLAAGAGPIYQIAKAFRAVERGALHNVEFTMLEWYRPGDDMAAGMRFLSNVCEELLETGPAEEVSYRDAFLAFAKVDPFRASIDELAVAAGGDAKASPDIDRDGWLNLILAGQVERHLGASRPTILYGYPPSQAALAQIASGDFPSAERFELYVGGVELANGYRELLNPRDLRERGAAVNRQRVAEGKRALPEDNRLLAAMEHGLPDCCGVALGFDRLAMLAAGAGRIDEVLTFPIERA